MLVGLLVAGIVVLAYFLSRIRREDPHITIGWKNRAKFQIDWIGPLGFDSASVLVARKGFGSSLNASTLSALAASPDSFQLAVSKYFEQRDNGLPLLTRSYKLSLRGAPQLLDEAQL